MPQLFRVKKTNVPAGIKCDRCGDVHPQGLHTFVVNHVCGYDSVVDQLRVTAALCDNCLLSLLTEHVPGAAFTLEGKRQDPVAIQSKIVDKRARAAARGHFCTPPKRWRPRKS